MAKIPYRGFRPLPGGRGETLLAAAILGIVVLLAALAGILTRNTGTLAVLWPANALMLGLMVRNPPFARPPAWLAAAAAFVIADVLTGSTLEKSLWLTAANLVGVLAGYLVMIRLDVADRKLVRPQSILRVFVAAAVAALAAAAVGAAANVAVFDGTVWTGARIWFSAELGNYMAILPLVLVAPVLRLHESRGGMTARHLASLRHMRDPLLLLLVSIGAGLVVGGPGALAFPVPALIWAAFRTGIFATTVLTFITSVFTMFAVGSGLLEVGGVVLGNVEAMSMQLGVALTVMGPIAVAANVVSRHEVMVDLRRIASRDDLTGALSRRGFLEEAGVLMADLADLGRPVAALMIDVDNFKRINDTDGHGAGDAVLRLFSEVTGEVLRDSDVFGRLGGDEFAVVIPGITRTMAEEIGERIRANFAAATVGYHGLQLGGTVSIGLHHETSSHPDLAQILRFADGALYRAKASGRDRVLSNAA